MQQGDIDDLPEHLAKERLTGGTPDSTREVAVVVRFTEYDGVGPAESVALMACFADPQAADAEAARLNSVRRNERVQYFVKILPIRSNRDTSRSERG